MIFLYLTIFRKLYFLREAFDFDSFFFFFFLFYFLRFRRILSLLFFNPLFRTFFLFRLHFIFFELRSNSFHCSKTPFAESSFLSMHWMRGGFRFHHVPTNLSCCFIFQTVKLWPGVIIERGTIQKYFWMRQYVMNDTRVDRKINHFECINFIQYKKNKSSE